MNTLALFALLALPVPARADEPPAPPPPITVELGNEAASVTVKDGRRPAPGVNAGVLGRSGVLDPLGRGPTPYSTITPSPFFGGAAWLGTTGVVESLTEVTMSYLALHSQKALHDPDGVAASAADHEKKTAKFTQDWVVGSVYTDAGRVVSLGEGAKAAFFAGGDAYGFGALHHTGHNEGSVGAGVNAGALLMVKGTLNELNAFVDLGLDGVQKDMFRNGQFAAAPAAATVGAEYRRTAGPVTALTGVEAQKTRADGALRPYVGVESKRASALLAADLRKSNDPFYPDVVGVGAELKAYPRPGVGLGVTGSASRKQYSMAPAPEMDYRVMGVFDLSVNRFLQLDVRGTAVPAAHGAPAAARTAALEERTRNPDYKEIFKSALVASPTMSEFVRRVPVADLDQLLAALSAFTAAFSKYDYNSGDDTLPNVEGVEKLYARGRASYLQGRKDPILVCIGSSQFVAVLARELGRQAGIPIEASAVTVAVPDSTGQFAGHAVAAVKTQPYGIVFVDWGKTIPTYTFDTKRAMAVFQALVGMPDVYTAVSAGRDGHNVGYLFSDDGKNIVEHLSFHADVPQAPLGRVFNDDPNGRSLTVERFKALTRGKF